MDLPIRPIGDPTPCPSCGQPCGGIATQDSETTSRLIARIREREAGGRETYGATVDRTDLGSAEWFRHFEDEMIDGLLYLRRLGQTMGVTP